MKHVETENLMQFDILLRVTIQVRLDITYSFKILKH